MFHPFPSQDVLHILIVECKADLYRLNEGKDVEAKFNQNVAHEKWFWYGPRVLSLHTTSH